MNMLSGAGMLDFLACQSVEKLALDAEGIAMAWRLLAGIEPRGESLAAELFAQLGHSGDFFGAKHTRRWFKAEQHLPSALIDRASVRAWAEERNNSHPHCPHDDPHLSFVTFYTINGILSALK